MRVFIFTLSILLVDQLSKQWVLAADELPWWLIDGQVGFRLSFNEGVAFSVPITGWWVISINILIICGLLFYFSQYIKSSLFSHTVQALVIGGALGNLVDRFTEGAVVDFIQIYWYPIFNLADMFVFVGVGLMVFFYKKLEV
ncbi:MAG: signal peptidase II [Candidatus Gracilibacteria bacterium]|nr:signal peptidase II [Candidatus Gracilibacteria bacterium]